ncbi:uncharacterized protein ACA1_053810 [Acanthamoeba castellanii str. Neff]|uniref:Uncharacterized protein n=1 Tax=Acanthamoeba castellanii (strain ATCC 30010 / Neff) TaxID=1257118 RepID=L8H604_ACACF|nr:uncharacterized protein ACA1_053810 [Acanthamoeba castellanii str. Neff]ELR20637.1 hypothetical protein ACA1_053810 [Acanthamoeba castellanii str. Neff]
MSGLRDLVADAACEGGNPLMNAMNRLWEDPTARQRQQQQHRRGSGTTVAVAVAVAGLRMQIPCHQQQEGPHGRFLEDDGRGEEELLNSHQGVEGFFGTGGNAFAELDPDIDAFADAYAGQRQQGVVPVAWRGVA